MTERLPPPIVTSDPGSFAMYTITHRKPEMIRQVIDDNRLDGEPRQRLLLLERELREGTVSDPIEAVPGLAEQMEPGERESWSREIRPNLGRRWLDLPWYFAETYFYLRLLVAFGYYDAGSPRFRIDPFEPAKERELFGRGGGLDHAEAVLAALGEGAETDAAGASERDPDQALTVAERMLLFQLWGNRIDLSNLDVARGARGRRVMPERDRLVVDHLDEAAERMLAATRIALIPDNSGPELTADLLALRSFLAGNPKRTATIHPKKAPMFVSDAMEKDVLATVRAMAAHASGPVSGAGRDLAGWIDAGRLRIREHYFWNVPLHFPDLPPDLRRDLASEDLAILKGDVNFRRILSDRKWPRTADMAAVASTFPTTFITLRTLKSEIMVDLAPGQEERLAAEDPRWLVNGNRGIVRLVDIGS